MVGFGFMDNLVMIQAGDAIDSTIGVAFGLSTLTAAAYGQVISDVSGTVFGSAVESAAKWLGLPAAGLTRAQCELRHVRVLSTTAASIGVVLGCLMGMTSLLFMDLDKNERLKKQRELRTLFATLMEDGHRLIGAERCGLFLVDADGEHIFRQGFRGHQPTSEELQRTFDAYDTASSGYVDAAELARALRQLGWQPEPGQVEKLFNSYDLEKNGQLSFPEFSRLITRAIMADEVRLAVREGGTRHHVLSTGKMLSVADVQTNPLCDHDVYRLQGYDIRSLLIGPVLDAEGKVIGLVELVNKDPARKEGASFSKDDEKLLGMLCSHCSIFIESLEV